MQPNLLNIILGFILFTAVHLSDLKIICLLGLRRLLVTEELFYYYYLDDICCLSERMLQSYS